MKKLNIFISHPSDFLTDHRAHGDGLCAFDLINRLAERGHRVVVAYSDADLAKPLHQNISLKRITCRLPSSRLQVLEYMARVRSLFLKLHREDPFDVIHQLNPVFPGRSALLTGKGVPLVLGVFVASWPSDAEQAPPVHFKGRIGEALIEPLIQQASRWQQARAAAILVSTPAAKQDLHAPESVSSRVKVLPYGINVDEYCPAPESETKAENGEKILFLGSLERRKGVFFLAEAFRKIWRARPNARLVFVGKGSQRHALESLVKEDESSQAVEFLGEVTGATKIALIRSADVVAVPSLGEPHGMVAVEAMSCGKPVVGTLAGGLKHLIPVYGGRLVPPMDSESLAQALIELLGDPALRAEMGRYNRQFALNHFSSPHIMAQLEKVYYSVVAEQVREPIATAAPVEA